MKKFSKLKEIKLILDLHEARDNYDREDILKDYLIDLLEQKIDLNKTRDDDKIKLFLNDVELKSKKQIETLIWNEFQYYFSDSSFDSSSEIFQID